MRLHPGLFPWLMWRFTPGELDAVEVDVQQLERDARAAERKAGRS